MFSEKYLDFRAAIGEFGSVNEPYTNVVCGFMSYENVYISLYDEYIKFDITSDMSMLIHEKSVSFCCESPLSNEVRDVDIDSIAEFKINIESIEVLTISGFSIIICL